MTLYTQTYSKRWQKLSIRFLEAIDLSDNLSGIATACDTIKNGWQSFLLMPMAFVVALCWATLAYRYDIYSSWDAMTILRTSVEGVLSGMTVSKETMNDPAIPTHIVLLSLAVQALPVTFTLLPTFLEMLGSKFARFNIPALQLAVWAFILFDLCTDMGPVTNDLEVYRPAFYNTTLSGLAFVTHPRDLAGLLIYGVVWAALLLVASYFLELLTLLFVWAGVTLMWKSVGYWIIKWLIGNSTAGGVRHTQAPDVGGGTRMRGNVPPTG